MAISPDLMDAFNDCIDALNGGETVESALGRFPAQADQLRPMLEAGLIFPKVRFPQIDVNAAQSRVEPDVQQAVEAIFRGGLWGSWPVILLVVVIFGAGILVAIVSNQPDDALMPPTATTSPTLTQTPSPTVTSTETSTMTLTTTATQLPTGTALPITLSPVVDAAQPVEEQPPLIVIEGPVEEIAEDSITIFDTVIEVDPDDPLLDAITIGDIVRVEGDYITRADIILLSAVKITFVEIEVYVDSDSGTVWRDDNSTCANPPPPWAPANGWRRRCEGGGTNVNSFENDDDD